ncbi:MAG: hypothetical protein IKH28_00825 [Lachnospiraceae bacterium]|nr:hypothetical protein [Lachnospiraceae bacterium]
MNKKNEIKNTTAMQTATAAQETNKAEKTTSDVAQATNDTTKVTSNTPRIAALNELKKEAGVLQMNGLPYMLASLVIWSLILLWQFVIKNVVIQNWLTFFSTPILMPVAYLVSKPLGADIFKKTDNPVSKLAFLCTMNQMLYILIVMWAFSESPKAMVMLFACIFGAHLLPFAWTYNCKSYMVCSIVEAIGSIFIGSFLGNKILIPFMLALQIILCISLWRGIKKSE